MPGQQGGVYQRGPFWLDFARGRDGRPASPNLYIWWYDAGRGRQRRISTGTADVRLACDKLDAHFLATHKPTDAERDAYTLGDALADYWIEHGSKADSAEAIRSRLAHVTRFMELELKAGRLSDPIGCEAVDDGFVRRFREWMLAEPIVARRKAGGIWIPGKSRPRAPATVEEALIALKAALNHAESENRIHRAPAVKHLTRKQVTPARTDRASVAAIGEMLDYSMRGGGRYGGHAARLMPLRRYLIGAIATVARPDAIVDMSTNPKRQQWMREDRRFALNPAGRVQRKEKHRPIIPVGDVLDVWLWATDDWWICGERERTNEAGERVTVQTPVRSIRSAWDTMRLELGLPEGWGPKLLRHSMAAELRRRRVDPWELQGQMGHRMPGSTETYAHYAPDYLGTVQAAISDVFADLGRIAPAALHPKLTQEHGNVAVLQAARNG